MHLLTYGIAVILIHKITALGITDIRLQPITPHTNTSNEGLLLLKTDGEWHSVCKDGSDKAWGEQETLAACRQLKYIGGWYFEVHTTTAVYQDRYMKDFDCSKSDTNLENCRGVVSNRQCSRSQLVAVHCYGTFKVQLKGGVAPNVGRVEVRYDDTWSNVCYEINQIYNRRWDYTDAEIVCKELGFPGTMFAKQGEQGSGIRTSIVYDYKCPKTGSNSLKECVPDPPITLSPYHVGPSCKGKGNDAVAICAVLGYVGCFKTDSDIYDIAHQHYLANQTSLTIRKCRLHCSGYSKLLALLYKGHTCLCKDDIPQRKVNDEQCAKQCTGNQDDSCGGFNTISVYKVNEGICVDPLNENTLYYYGDIFENCTSGKKTISSKPIQCVKGVTNNEMKWSNNFTGCTESIQNGNRGWENHKIAIFIGSSIGGLLLLVIVCASIVSHLRKQPQQEEECDSPTYEEIEPSNYGEGHSEFSAEAHQGPPIKAFAASNIAQMFPSTKVERSQCQTSHEVCSVCRNSYTEFTAQYASAYNGLEECSKEGQLIKNDLYEGTGSK